MLTIPKKSTQVHSGQRSTVNGQLWPDSASARGNSASLDVLTNSLRFPFYTSSIPPDSTSSSWKNRGATPTQLAESQEQLGESQFDSDHLLTLSNSPWLTDPTHNPDRTTLRQSSSYSPSLFIRLVESMPCSRSNCFVRSDLLRQFTGLAFLNWFIT